MLQPNKATLEGVRQQSAAILPTATKKNAPRYAFSRMSGAAEASAAIGAREGKCAVSLPEGVEELVAGAACSLLLQTNPPCHARLDWEVSLLSYSDETRHHSGGRRPHECVGFPVAFVLGTSSGGVQSCSFIATRAGVIVCRARTRGRAMEPCSFSVNVVASQPCALASRVHLVHPLPSVDVVAVGQDVSLRLLVPAASPFYPAPAVIPQPYSSNRSTREMLSATVVPCPASAASWSAAAAMAHLPLLKLAVQR
jgi:hypothetical protein